MADSVWIMVMFDLPTLTKEQRREASGYRNLLIDRGFGRVQLSVYSKYLINSTAAIPMLNWLKSSVPDQGYVRIIQLTDRQWASSWHLYGSAWIPPEEPPEQLFLF